MLAYLSIGSNQGDSLSIFKNVLVEIEKQLGPITKMSSIYCTQAWGYTKQNDFLNQVVVVKPELKNCCQLSFQNLCNNILQIINKIETDFGRVREKRWGPRTLDIDILFVSDKILFTKSLIIPHKEIANRRFVLEPLNEIAPDFVHPVLKKTIKALLEQCQDESVVRILKL